MKVINRSDGTAVYSLDELNVRRVFNIGEVKEISSSELESLFQKDGGNFLLKHYLQVMDEDWVSSHWDAPEEYFWDIPQITKCIKEDSLELFSETLDYAPEGVLDIIKSLSWKLPLSDLNKIEIIREKLGFDVLSAVKVMSDTIPQEKPKQKERLRKRARED